VAMAVLIVLLIAFVCMRRRKQRAQHTPDASAAEVSTHHQTVELLGHKGSYSISELPSPRIVHELDGSVPEKSPVVVGELMGSPPEKHLSREAGSGR
jgi:hypothetical protein